MIIHRSNDTKKKRKVDTTNNNLILNENSISDISTDNICTNNCDINTNNAVTPNRSTVSAQKVTNPYRKASLPSNPSNTNLVTPIRPSFAQVHNPYKKKTTTSEPALASAAILVSQDQTNYYKSNINVESTTISSPPINDIYSEKHVTSRTSDNNSSLSDFQPRIQNSLSSPSSHVKRTLPDADMFSIEDSDELVSDYSFEFIDGSENSENKYECDTEFTSVTSSNLYEEENNDTACDSVMESTEEKNHYNFKVSPFGCYCSLCDMPVGGNNIVLHSIRSHNQRHSKNKKVSHPKLSMPKLKKLVRDLNVEFNLMKKKDSYLSFMKPDFKNAHLCTICNSILTTTRSKKQHFDPKVSSPTNPTLPEYRTCTVDRCIPIRLQKTICGRWIRDEVSSEESVPINLLHSSRLKLTLDSARTLLTLYEREDEDIDPYLPIVLKWMIECEDNNKRLYTNQSVIDIIIEDNKKLMSNERSNELVLFLKYAKDWLYQKATSNVQSIGSNYRVKLQSFDVNEMDDGTSMQQCFNMRKNLDALWSELEMILIYFWQHLDIR